MATALTQADFNLFVKVTGIIWASNKKDHHHINAANRPKDEQVDADVYMEAYTGRITLFAEVVTICMAGPAGECKKNTLVVLGECGMMVSLCGMCRELISYIGPQVWVIMSGTDSPEKMTLRELIPDKERKS